MNSGFRAQPLETPEVGRARHGLNMARREEFEQAHPEVSINLRRVDGRLVFEVSEPGKAAVAWDDANAMLDDLEKRYPA
jgi:hypothetical protein